MAKKPTYEELVQRVKVLEKETLKNKQPEKLLQDITDRKLARDELQKSEGKLNAMLQSIGDHISMIDKDLNIIWVNEISRKTFGNDIIGKKCYEVFHRRKTPCEPYPCITLKAFQDGKVHEHDTQIISKYGKTMFFHRTANVSLKDEDGKPVSVISIFRDITERKQAEERLVYESRMREVLMKLSSAYINVPLQEINQSINESLREVGEFVAADRAYIFEYDWGAGVTNNTFEWCREGVSPQIDELQEVSLDGAPEWTETHRQGKPMHVPDVSSLPEGGRLRQSFEAQEIKSLITTPLMKEKDCIGFIGFDSIKEIHAYSENEEKLLNIFAGIIMNITERKQAEETLRETNEYLEKLIDHANAPIILLDPDFRITRINNAFQHLTGYSTDEVIGQEMRILFPKGSRRQSLSMIKRASSGEYWKSIEIPIICKHGGIRIVLWNSANIYADDDTTVIFTIAQGQDITERKKAKQALIKREEELKNKTISLEELNNALKVLLKKRDEDKIELEESVLSNVKGLISPYMISLKRSRLDDRQMGLLGIIESNINEIIAPFSRRLSSKYSNLTPNEIQVAGLVKEGKTTKEIAHLLNSATETIAFHRKNLRKKLGLRNKKSNLRSYLLSLP